MALVNDPIWKEKKSRFAWHLKRNDFVAPVNDPILNDPKTMVEWDLSNKYNAVDFPDLEFVQDEQMQNKFGCSDEECPAHTKSDFDAF